MNLFIVLAVHISIYGKEIYGKLPSGIHVQKCPRNDPSTTQCIMNGIEALRPDLKMGIPKFNIPRIEPFKRKYIELAADRPGLILKGEASNIVARGGGAFKLQNVKIDFKNYVLEVHVVIPRLEVTADYTTYGSRLYLVNINGSGQFKGTFTDVNAFVNITGHPIMKKGLEYAKVDDVTAEIRFGSGLIDCTPDNPTLKETIAAKFVKKNSMKALEILDSVINDRAGLIIQEYVSKIVKTIPLNDIFSS